jgi:hypothetical protein
MQRPLLLLGQAPLGERLVVTARLGGRVKPTFVLKQTKQGPRGFVPCPRACHGVG